MHFWPITATIIRISQHLTWTQLNWEFASAEGVVKPLMELRLLEMLYTPALHTWMISKPMFSPSRSQSVQITRAWHCWISRSRVLWEEKNNTGRTFQATCSVISFQNDSLNTKCNVYPWRWVVAITFCNCVSWEIRQLLKELSHLFTSNSVKKFGLEQVVPQSVF